jgi:hypothetical protein
MESRIPLPTDNIYKFYALFGLLLLIFGLSATIYTTKSTNEFMVTAVVDLEELKSIVLPSIRETARRQILQRQIEVAKSDKEFFRWASSGVGGIGLALMIFGFKKWHVEVQPTLDEIAQLQLLKLRYEVDQQKPNPVRRIHKRT